MKNQNVITQMKYSALKGMNSDTHHNTDELDNIKPSERSQVEKTNVYMISLKGYATFKFIETGSGIKVLKPTEERGVTVYWVWGF